MDPIFWLFVWTLVGAMLGMLALVFFQDEIFSGIDTVVEKVRAMFGLD